MQAAERQMKRTVGETPLSGSPRRARDVREIIKKLVVDFAPRSAVRVAGGKKRKMLDYCWTPAVVVASLKKNGLKFKRIHLAANSETAADTNRARETMNLHFRM